MRTVNMVENLLRTRPDLRDSDKALLLAFWEVQGFGLSDSQRRIFMDKCTTAESITRARRALKDKYPASETVDNQRFEKYLDHKYNRPFEYVVVED